MIYLDAHKVNYCPFVDELELIVDFSQMQVIVDDFELSSKPEFRFDKYGDVSLSLERDVPILRNSSARIFSPTHDAA
jgi:hypothetical protein